MARKETVGRHELAELLGQLRRQAGMTRERLVELSGVSIGPIKRIELEGHVPKAQTLQMLATGLATYGPGRRDDELAAQHYDRLMRAAGYLPVGDEIELIEPPPREEPWAPLRQLPGASIALADLARGAPEWDDEDRRFVEGSLEQLAQRFGRSARSG